MHVAELKWWWLYTLFGWSADKDDWKSEERMMASTCQGHKDITAELLLKGSVHNILGGFQSPTLDLAWMNWWQDRNCTHPCRYLYPCEPLIPLQTLRYPCHFYPWVWRVLPLLFPNHELTQSCLFQLPTIQLGRSLCLNQSLWVSLNHCKSLWTIWGNSWQIFETRTCKNHLTSSTVHWSVPLNDKQMPIDDHEY